ncbi:excisionase family DNA-binding protein [Thermodesulfobacteriota bacterium]
MKDVFMTSNGDETRRRGKDRRKKSDRRDGSDRRLNGNGYSAELEDANGQDDILTTKEACEYLKISRPTYLKCIADGKIKAQKVGRGWRALKSELKKSLCEE